MRILGIDPGISACGWGIVEKNGHGFKALDWGVVDVSSAHDSGERLMMIYDNLIRKIDQLKPKTMAVERLFFSRNHKTAISVAQAQGAILMAAYEMGLPVHYYTPMQVKLTICADGRADKKTVQRKVRDHLHMNETPKPDDAADGLAIALCHGHRTTKFTTHISTAKQMISTKRQKLK